MVKKKSESSILSRGKVVYPCRDDAEDAVSKFSYKLILQMGGFDPAMSSIFYMENGAERLLDRLEEPS